jgi:hypothetical protein
MVSGREVFLLAGPDLLTINKDCESHSVRRRFAETRAKPKNKLLSVLRSRQFLAVALSRSWNRS